MFRSALASRFATDLSLRLVFWFCDREKVMAMVFPRDDAVEIGKLPDWGWGVDLRGWVTSVLYQEQIKGT